MNLIELFIVILPAYVANASPVLFGRGVPIDFGKKLSDGKRLFGDGKTVIGFFSGLVLGTLSGFIIFLNFSEVLPDVSLSQKLVLGFVLSLGALLGDLLGSFFKRRLGVERGKPMLLLDQLPFILLALLLSFAYIPVLASKIGFFGFFFIIALTIFLHKATNIIAYYLKLKKVPW